MKESVDERLKRLAGHKNPENRKIEKPPKVDRRKFNHAGPGSGRKPKEENLTRRGIKAYLDTHINEKVKIRVTDPKTGKSKEVSKPRLIIILEKLFAAAAVDGNVDAMNKWLDRALGKPLQPVGGDEDHPIMIKIDF